MKKIKEQGIIILFFVSMLSLANCRFHSLYNSNNISRLGAIEILPSKSVEEAKFHDYISRLIFKDKVSRYILTINVNNFSYPIIIQRNAKVLRQAINQKIDYNLIDKGSSRELTKGQFIVTFSYNTNVSPYSSFINNEIIYDELMKQAAEEIIYRISIFFLYNPL